MKIPMIFLSLLFIVTGVKAQRSSDTSTIIKELNDVMSFAVKPYLHYTSTMYIQTTGPDESNNRVDSLPGQFYKYGDDLYVGNNKDELFLQDSLLVHVDHAHKMVRVSRVDMSTRQNIDLMPLKRSAVQKMLRSQCTVAKLPKQGDTDRIVIRSKADHAVDPSVSSEMMVEYSGAEHLPDLLQIAIRGQDPNSGRMMTQTASVRIGAMQTTQEDAAQMPKWQELLAFEPASGTFSGKSRCAGYEVVKTF